MKKIVAALALAAAMTYVPPSEACNLNLDAHTVFVPESKIILSVVPPKDKDEQRRREAGQIGHQIGNEIRNEVRRRVNPKVRDGYDRGTSILNDIQGAIRRGKQDGQNQFPGR